MTYIKPEKVISPKASWYLIEVIRDDGEGNGAYAVGDWEGKRRVGFRWNGTAENPIGNPQSRGLPTWIILDPALNHAVIGLLTPEKQETARTILRLKEGEHAT